MHYYRFEKLRELREQQLRENLGKNHALIQLNTIPYY